MSHAFKSATSISKAMSLGIVALVMARVEQVVQVLQYSWSGCHIYVVLPTYVATCWGVVAGLSPLSAVLVRSLLL